jgi:CRISPR-associated protein Cmr2
MSFNKPSTEYWNNKFTAYMHDPIDKVFDIKGHEKRAEELFEKYGFPMPNDDFWKTADGIASGFERGQVPSFNKDENKNGAIDFLNHPFISHPTSSMEGLNIKLLDNITAEKVWVELLEHVTKTIGMKAGKGGYSDCFKGDESNFAIARFLYTHLVLRFKLAEENVANIGALWHRIPADSRFPDHSIWQHNQLTSAIYSCMELDEGDTEKRKDNIGLMVFSITPVQPFIAKARKLRDYWSGSVLLSYLSFEGIRWIIENLGPDHIVYPSLIDQPLIAEYLKNRWRIDNGFSPDIWEKHNKAIASFPNKFLFFAPVNKMEDIAEEIESHIKKEWLNLTEIVFKKLVSQVKIEENSNEASYLHKLFERQNNNYWDMQWSAVRLVGDKDKDNISKLLAESAYKNQINVLGIFNEIIKDREHYEKAGKGVLYSVSHSLVQSALAAEKTQKYINREDEPGEKCQMCGEFEVSHTKEYKYDISAKEYKDNIKGFWNDVEKLWDSSADFKKGEKLCSVCLTKRIIGEALREYGEGHILNSVFKDSDSFPSTTMMALYDYYKRKNITNYQEQKEFAQELYENESDKYKDIKDRDKYYAILLMDGDKMGDLVNGKTIGSTWESVMHPDMVKRLKNPNFEAKYRENWQEIFKNQPKRILTPSIHAAISESLGDFAMYGVAPIIKKYDGRLIYAGGDDVCAIMPVDTVLEAADEIRKYYRTSFRIIKPNGVSEEITGDEFKPEAGKLSLNLGNGEKNDDKISISAGILVCHHKENLSEMIKRAHSLLEKKAKEEAERNACAIELRKRSGGSRYFVGRWDEESVWNLFGNIGKAIKSSKKEGVSTSLVYRLEAFRVGIEAILDSSNDNKGGLLEKFIKKQLERSQLKVDIEEMAKAIRKVSVFYDRNDKKEKFNPEGLIVAGFMAGSEENV